MTKEALETGNELRNSIGNIERLIYDMRPYHGETLEVKLHKAGKDREYTLRSDDPLTLAIFSALVDLKNELSEKFDNLSCDDTSKENQIKSTSAYKKVWNLRERFKFI